MRLIDAEQIRDVLAPIAPMSVCNDVHYERIAFMDEIDQLPNIEAEPVTHAHWIPRYQSIGKAYSFKCSRCKKIVWCHTKVSVDDIDYNFCPYCGAKMKANGRTNKGGQ